MNSIKETLLIEMSRYVIDMVVDYVGGDEERFAELMDIMLTGENPLPQRAAWAVTHLSYKHPFLLKKYINELIDLIESFGHPSLGRCVLRYLSENPLPEDKMGYLLDLCYKYLLDLKTPIANRVYAMQIIYNISCLEPDLKEELRLTIESLYDTGSAGFKNRAGKLLAKLNKLEKASSKKEKFF